MDVEWLHIGVGHGSPSAERALTDKGFRCSRQAVVGPTELKVLVRKDTNDRSYVEKTLREANGEDPWINPVTGSPTHTFPGYREGT